MRSMVRAQFRSSAHITDEDEIDKLKGEYVSTVYYQHSHLKELFFSAVRALSNYLIHESARYNYL